MTEDEIEAVARELAKVGGSSWYPGRTKGPILRAVSERYKDRARVAIATLERFRAAKEASDVPGNAAPPQDASLGRSTSESQFQAGMTVVYRPPGDQRAISCRIERIADDQAYLIPLPQPTVGWVSLESLQPQKETDIPTELGNRAE
jgi:hypothetical protein